MSSIFKGDLWETYKQKLGNIESSNTYNIIGGSGDDYDGKYQFGRIAKKDIGLGHTSDERESFRNDPKAQEKALTKFTKLNYKRLMKNPKFAKMDTDQQMGVLAYAHNQGAGGASNWLNTGIEGKDGFGTLGTKYYDAFTETPAFGNEELKMKLINYSKPSPLALTDSVPQIRPENLQQPNIPQLRPDNLSIQEQEVPQPQSFGQAFSQARKQHGGDGGVFEYKGNKYTTDIAKEVPAVAEPMFPREEFVPTVPSRVTSTADNRINVPPFKGLEIPELGFNNGTKGVPGYNEGTGMISAMDGIAKMREQYVKDLLERSNQQRIETDAIDEDLAFAQPVPQGNNNVNTPKEFVPQAQPGQQVQGGFGVPIPTEFSGGYKVEAINATPPGYDAGPAGTTVDAVPPGYNAGPVGTTINAVPPAYKAGPSVIPLADQFPTPGNDLMYKPNVSKEYRLGPIDANGNTLYVEGALGLMPNPKYRNNTGIDIVDQTAIKGTEALEVMEEDLQSRIEKANKTISDSDDPEAISEAQKVLNSNNNLIKFVQDGKPQAEIADAEKDLYAAASERRKWLDIMNKAPEGSSLYTKAETNIKRLDDIHNEAKNKLQTAQKFILTGNQNAPVPGELVGSIPEVKKEINLEDQFPTPGDDSVYESPAINTATLGDGVTKVDLTSKKQNEINKGTPNSVKEQVGGMLQNFFGLETSDLSRAVGFYLASRAAGYSHQGSMRWAGNTVLAQSESKRKEKLAADVRQEGYDREDARFKQVDKIALSKIAATLAGNKATNESNIAKAYDTFRKGAASESAALYGSGEETRLKNIPSDENISRSAVSWGMANGYDLSDASTANNFGILYGRALQSMQQEATRNPDKKIGTLEGFLSLEQAKAWTGGVDSLWVLNPEEEDQNKFKYVGSQYIQELQDPLKKKANETGETGNAIISKLALAWNNLPADKKKKYGNAKGRNGFYLFVKKELG